MLDGTEQIILPQMTAARVYANHPLLVLGKLDVCPLPIKEYEALNFHQSPSVIGKGFNLRMRSNDTSNIIHQSC
jgi:hypothetical protein